MNTDMLSSLTDPALLFFVVGLLIGAVRSNLEIPEPVTKFLSLYLLMAIGFKGGQAFSEVGLSGEALRVLGAAMTLSLVIPAIWFTYLRRRINAYDAAAIAATYGSVSAVTFVVATQYVADRGAEAGGYLAVALVVMESPAIVMAVLLSTWVRSRERSAELIGVDVVTPGGRLEQTDPSVLIADGAAQPEHRSSGDPPSRMRSSVRTVIREAFTDGAHLLLIGSMVVGALSGSAGAEKMAPFIDDLFTGLLAFFLLEMGLLVARQVREVRSIGPFLIGFGLVVPFVNAGLALGLGTLLGLSVPDLAVLAALAASGSYIVVPAVVRYAIPEARPSRYFSLALGVTFPVNIIVGIPVFYWVSERLGG